MSSDSPIPDTLHLYTYYRSSCSARLRIALHHKNLPVKSTYVSLLDGSHKKPEYVAQNPCGTVPTLIITTPAGKETVITQSIAALEYLEDAYPQVQPKLLPTDINARAKVRELVNIIACDIQPPTNMNVLLTISGLGGDKASFAKKKMSEGLKAYEVLLERYSGKYSVGDEISMADVVLQPAVWNAQRFGVDFSEIPLVRGVSERLAGVEAFKRAHWSVQEDTPEELRGRDV